MQDLGREEENGKDKEVKGRAGSHLIRIWSGVVIKAPIVDQPGSKLTIDARAGQAFLTLLIGLLRATNTEPIPNWW